MALYDTEHRFGIFATNLATSNNDGEGISGDLTASMDQSDPFYFYAEDWTGGIYGYGDPVGTPVIGLHSSNQSESFASWEWIACSPGIGPLVCVPIKSSETGGKLRTSPLSRSVQLQVDAYIASTKTEAAEVASWMAVPDLSSRSIVLRVEYLDGCNLHEVGFQEMDFEVSESGHFTASWGTTIFPTPSFKSFNPNVDISGPVRAHILVDGYESDWIDISFEPPTKYQWTAILAKADGSDAPAPADLYSQELPLSDSQTERALDWLLGGEVTSLTSLTVYMDTNGDDVIDCADYPNLNAQ